VLQGVRPDDICSLGFSGIRLCVAVREARELEPAFAAMAPKTGCPGHGTPLATGFAEAIQGLVHHMRTEQQMIRDWVDSQAEQHRDIRRLLEILVRENVNK